MEESHKMSIERASDSTPSMFGSNPDVTITPWSAQTATFMGPTYPIPSLFDDQRLHMEAEMNTPEGRKKAREMRRAEIKEREKNWGSRVIYDRGDGWKPIWPLVQDKELRIYTLLKTFEHRFWGIKPIGMTIDEFWDKYDPEVKRVHDRTAETPVNPDAPVGPLIGEPPKSLTTKEAAAKPVKRQKTPDSNSTHRVRKSTAPSRTPGMDRPKRAKTVSASQQKQATEYEGPAKYFGEPPASKAKADQPHPLALPVHKMRTRQDGPAELLRLP